jgi:hypothetical protein
MALNHDEINAASLPRDDDAQHIQVLSPKATGTVHRTTTQGASASVALPTGARVVRIASSVAVWLAFGGSGVAAADTESDSMLFPAGTEYFHLRDDTFTYLAARSVANESGLVTATAME